MEEEHYRHHHHHHHHHEHQTTDQNQSHANQGAEIQQSTAVTRVSAPISVPRPTGEARLTAPGGVQPTSSFHSVSSIDSSAEMAKYFPDAQTPSLSPFRHHQEEEDGQAQSTTATTTTNITSASTAYATVPLPRTAATSNVTSAGPYASVPAPRIAPATVQRPQVPPVPRPQPPPGIPSYPSQIEGLTVSQALVNDVIVDLQSKVINESQQQYLSESSTGNYMEPLPPIHIRAPNPTIILQSDLNRLRAEFQHNVRARAQQHRAGGFSQPRFQAPPPQKYPAPGYY